ncbi:MAG: hypothetical protein FJ410_05305 [Verrucomicrobia bacterium]|nr:hypothetical protein [Verrucomicrobiota bacterium]
MASSRSFIILTVGLCVLTGIGISRYATPIKEAVTEATAAQTKAPKRASAVDPGGEIKARSTSGLVLNSEENVRPDFDRNKEMVKEKSSAAKAALEERFASFNDNSRKMVEEISGGDRDKMRAAFGAALQDEKFKELFRRRHELEGQWKTATDGEKEGIMREMELIRTIGLARLKEEMGRINGAPQGDGLPPGVRVQSVTLPANQNGAAPANAPDPAPFSKRPVIIQ